MFHPAPNVIGYTDMLLGYGIIHSIFRALGMDIFSSYKLTLIAIHCFGTASMYYLLKRTLKLSHIWSLFGTISFSFSNAYAIHFGHTQLAAISVLPFLTILLVNFFMNINIRKIRNLYAYLFIIFFVLLTYNSWYIAYFSGLFMLLFIIIFLLMSKNMISKLKWDTVNRWCQIQRFPIDLIGYLILLIILYIPFIQIYLPVLKMSNGYSYQDTATFLPEFIDLINVSEDNFLLGWLMSALDLSTRGYSSELTQGFSCILIILFIAAFLGIRKKQLSSYDNEKQLFIWIVEKSIFFTIIISLLLTIRLSSNGISLWAIVYYIIPMAKSIRAVARFLLWLSFPMSLITAYALNKVSIKSIKCWQICSIFFLVLLFISNITKIGVNSHWNSDEEMTFITSIAAPPKSMDSFYIIDSQNSNDPFYIYQLDAFEIATYYHTKTINGYSGQSPSGWNGINDPLSRDYERNVLEWIQKYQLSNVYAYDRKKNIWIPFKERILALTTDTFQPATGKFSLYNGLMDHAQGEYCWTSQNFSVRLINPYIQETGLSIKMEMPFAFYKQQNPGIVPKVELYIDNKYIQDLPVVDGYAEYKIPLDYHTNDYYYIQLKTNVWFNPKQIGLNEDTRNLSIGLYYIGN